MAKDDRVSRGREEKWRCPGTIQSWLCHDSPVCLLKAFTIGEGVPSAGTDWTTGLLGLAGLAGWKFGSGLSARGLTEVE